MLRASLGQREEEKHQGGLRRQSNGLVTTHHRRRQRKRFQEEEEEKTSSWISQPSIVVGVWLLEVGPADGNWASFDELMILSSTTNASHNMLGQNDVDLSGFPLHPNPRDEYFAGSVKDYGSRGHVPEVATKAGGAAGVRYRPLGGEDARGEFVWVCGQMVAKSSDAVCFLVVDLGLHGPIREEGVKALEDALLQ